MEEKDLDYCSICFDDINQQDAYKTKCNHFFHKECFANHLKANQTNILKCPLCNEVLRIPQINYEMIQTAIDDYINAWDTLDCNELIKEMKITYKIDEGKFEMNEALVRQLCEERQRQLEETNEEMKLGGKKKTKRHSKRKHSKKRNSKKRHSKKRHFKRKYKKIQEKI